MQTQPPNAVLRKDYQTSLWQISKTSLYFSLHPESTTVISELHLQLDSTTDSVAPLVLNGIDLQLISVAVNGEPLGNEAYQVDANALTLHALSSKCVLRIETLINPQANLALEGLYRSSGNYCTQCEPEGFRKITYYLDRPDVLSVFDVKIEADAESCPVLLSNGNLVSREQLPNGRLLAHWHDPHPKPCYLFALVAGALSVVEDSYITASGSKVLLQIYVQEHNLGMCDYAMGALKRSMHWDEQCYGFEYDLERFMIVAVDDFNMGAMENKGLNIFNSRYVLADINSATDADFLGVEAVIAHEYFHNWTGNRITCRDWFQLSLKEGLTVFRDQCFSSDMHSSTVKRIADVRLLRARQFAEDASAMAHPIRPDSYIEINNFYTLTVYEKGAEVIRMLHTLLGEEQWRKGMDEYVKRHDGTATTCDAFIAAMQSVTQVDLTLFKQWYSVAGTPCLSVDEHYDSQAQRYTLRIEQHTPDTPGQKNKPALHVPIRMGLLDHSGASLKLCCDDTEHVIIEKSNSVDGKSAVLNLKSHSQTFVFNEVASKPVASLLRGFSAPVKLEHELDNEQLALLIAYDTDEFNRWEALQRLVKRAIIAKLEGLCNEQTLECLNSALNTLLNNNELEPAFKAQALQLASIDTLAEELSCVNYPKLSTACDSVSVAIAQYNQSLLKHLVLNARDEQLELLDDRAMGLRALANAALNVLSYLPESQWLDMAGTQFALAKTMSDKLTALGCLCHTESSLRDTSLQEFLDFAGNDKLVVDKWFLIQACSRRLQVLDDVKRLYKHEKFELRNPNCARALLMGFALNNPVAFHCIDGSGYEFIADRVLELDAINPQVAAALVKPLTRCSKLEERAARLMREQLSRILAAQRLSPDVYELVSKSMNN